MLEHHPRHVYDLFYAPGEVTEIRAFGLSGKSQVWEGFTKPDQGIIGYFNNAEDFGKAAAALGRAGADGIYFVPNPPDPALLSRAKNRLVAATKKRPATSDHNIIRIRWLLLDFDPVRPAGISATEVELEAAKETAKKAYQFLCELGFAEPIKAASGNGFHLNYRLAELPNTEEISKGGGLIQRCLAALQDKCGNDQCKIDQAVYNASRIWKLYGTWARKGDSTNERPHRKSYLFAGIPTKLADVPETPREVVEKLAALSPSDHGRSGAHPAVPIARLPTVLPRTIAMRMRPPTEGLGRFKLEEYLQHYGVGLRLVEPQDKTTKFVLTQCVFDPNHAGKDAAIFQEDTGKLTYHCFHSTCQARTWHDAREVISGKDPLVKFHVNYDPNYSVPLTGIYLGSGLIDRLPEIEDSCPEIGCPGVPAPNEVDPMEFFQVRGNNRRPTFVVHSLARYLARFLDPIVCTDELFWRYQNGVWRRYPISRIKKLITQAMHDRVQASWISETVAVMAGMVSKEERNWRPASHLINVKNGMVDLTTLVNGGELESALLPHDPTYDSRCQLLAEFNPDAECDRWVRFLWEVFPEGRDKCRPGEPCLGDQKMAMAQQFAGYLLMPTCKYERALFMVGAGSNGKSTFINAVSHVLGSDNTHQMALDQLARTFALPALQEKLLVHCSEMHTKETGAVQVLKQCISGDEITGEHKYKECVKFRPLCKFMFALNEIPTIVDKSYGFIRKLLILNFTRRFERDEIDPDLFEKLKSEADGIFMWMLGGAVDLVNAGGFRETEGVEYDKSEFLQSVNPFLLYVHERLDQGSGIRLGCEEVFIDYVNWCDRSRLSALGKIKFYQAVAHHLPKVKKVKGQTQNDKRQYQFVGIGFKAA